MNISIETDYEAMSKRAADQIVAYVSEVPDAVLSLAAGNTPLGAYRYVVEAAQSGRADFSRCLFVSLDEWVGLDADDFGSCRQTMESHLYRPLGLKEDQLLLFDGMTDDLERECRRMDEAVAARGGIDLFLLGIGMNGHLGFNEPGVSWSLYAHAPELDPVTQTVSAKYFDRKRAVSRGLTLGIRHVMEADRVLLLAGGKAKAEIVRKALHEEATPQVPGSALQRHPGLCVLLDAAAGARL